MPSSRADAPVLDVVVPVHDEEVDLERCVRRLEAHLRALPFTWRITIAENGSTDDTLGIAHELAAELAGVVVRVETEPGRGRALNRAWAASDAAVLVYTDVDLSTDLNALLPLVAPLISGHSDLAIGTRLAGSSRVVRGARREFISRSYNLILRGTLATHVSDAQCGFKAIRADVAARLLPLVEDTGWFFDTELLVLAERSGLRIAEVPVDWVDDPDSRVHIVSTAKADLAGIARLWRAGPLLRFAAVAALAMVAFLAASALLGAVVPALTARAVALVLTAVALAVARLLMPRRRVSPDRPPAAPVPLLDLESSR